MSEGNDAWSQLPTEAASALPGYLKIRGTPGEKKDTEAAGGRLECSRQTTQEELSETAHLRIPFAVLRFCFFAAIPFAHLGVYIMRELGEFPRMGPPSWLTQLAPLNPSPFPTTQRVVKARRVLLAATIRSCTLASNSNLVVLGLLQPLIGGRPLGVKSSPRPRPPMASVRVPPGSLCVSAWSEVPPRTSMGRACDLY